MAWIQRQDGAVDGWDVLNQGSGKPEKDDNSTDQLVRRAISVLYDNARTRKANLHGERSDPTLECSEVNVNKISRDLNWTAPLSGVLVRGAKALYYPSAYESGA